MRRLPEADAMAPPGAPVRRSDPPLAPAKFRDPATTATGVPRARVRLEALTTLWFNTGTLCNITCAHCYIESSPRNDRLSYLEAAEVAAFLDEIERERLPVKKIGFTGGEPFMNPEFIAMLEHALGRGYRVLVLTNAMRPMMRRQQPLRALRCRHGERLSIRVSLDHYTKAGHETERDGGSWERTLEGLLWLVREGFRVEVAGRTAWRESEASLRAGYARLFHSLDLPIDAHAPRSLVLFPEMDERADVPEITEACWSILGVEPHSLMCASARMVIKRKGAARPAVVACTLIPYDPAFELGATLREAHRSIALNHPHCARFCVLGGGHCSGVGAAGQERAGPR